MTTPIPGLSPNDLDTAFEAQVQEWMGSESFPSVVDQPSANHRAGFLPLTGEQMQIIGIMAAREGWALSENQGGSTGALFMIERDDEDQRFSSDLEAEMFVRKHAELGSDYHQLALSAHRQPVGAVRDRTVANVTLTLSVDYLPNGMSLDVLKNLLRQNVTEMIRNDGLTDATAAEVKGWSIDFQ